MSDEMNYKFGYVRSKPDHRDWVYGAVVGINPNLPKSVMSAKLPVLDQKDEGICVGFGTAYHKAIEELPTHEGQVITFSQRFVYELARKIDGFPDTSEGTSPKAAMQILQQYGICKASTLPYTPHTNPTITDEMYKEALEFRIKNYASLQTVEEIKTAIAQGKTVLSGVLCTSQFMKPENGGFVALPSGNIIGGHCINLDGYDDEMTHTYADGTTIKGFVRFINSWGTSYGDNGYGYLPYKFFEMRDPSTTLFYWMEGWSSVDLNNDVQPQPTPEPKQEKITIEMWINKDTAKVNGQDVKLDQPPTMINNRTVVPVRFVTESMGAYVVWDATQEKITIIK